MLELDVNVDSVLALRLSKGRSIATCDLFLKLKNDNADGGRLEVLQ